MIYLDCAMEVPLYIQVYRQFKDKIIMGELKSGERIPSTRKLCGDLNISRNTVELAYHQLHSEGYLMSKPRKGYYVADLDFSMLDVETFETGIDVLDSSKLPLEENDIVYDFKYGKLSTDKLPLRQWQKLTNKCLRAYQENLSYYGPTFGESGLREEIHKYLKYYRGVNCTSDQIFIGAGVHYCLGMLCQLMRKREKIVAMEDPGYHITRSTLRNHGFDVEPVPLDAFGIDVKKLNQTPAGAVYVTPSHQYPLGTIMPISRRLELIEWANENEALIIEDDYSCHLRYNIKPVQSLQSISNNRVAYIGSFSKFLIPSLRLAYMVIPKRMLSDFRQMFEGYPSSVSFQIQKTLELFMREGHWESYLRKNRKLQKKKHDLLVEALRRKFGENITIHGMNAGLHILVQVNNGINESQLIQRAFDHGIKVYPTKKFWQNQQRESHAVVLGFGGIDVESIVPAIDLLAKAWDYN